MIEWTFKNKIIQEEDLLGHVGFIYQITCIPTGRSYIGKKILTFRRKKTVKGKVKRVVSESDWKSYYGSCDELKQDVVTLGAENFKREIICFCKTKSEMSYLEAKYQFQYDCILHPDKFYNGWISVRVRSSQLKTLQKGLNDSSCS